MTTDAYIQLQTDGSGKKVDNAQITREKPDPAWSSTAGDVVHRQRVVLASDDTERTVQITGEAGDESLQVDAKTLGDILIVLSQIRDMLRMVVGC